MEMVSEEDFDEAYLEFANRVAAVGDYLEEEGLPVDHYRISTSIEDEETPRYRGDPESLDVPEDWKGLLEDKDQWRFSAELYIDDDIWVYVEGSEVSVKIPRSEDDAELIENQIYSYLDQVEDEE